MLLMLLFVVSMFATAGNITNAQETRDIMTYPFIDAIPKTAGVGQPVLVNFGLLNNLALVTDGWNVTAIITDPDGYVETFSRMTWSTGTVGFTYVPTKEGAYKLQCKFDGEYYDPGVARVPSGYYTSSESEVVILKVTTDWKSEHPGYQLPAEYWTRPIDSQFREWWSIAGSWVVNKPMNLYAPYNEAPESAHILWTMPIGDSIGGLSGGDNFDVGYHHGDAYDGQFAGSIIISGVLYYNKYAATSINSGATLQQAIVAVDLHTGETLWERSYDFGGGRISRGQILTWLDMNNRGVWSYIWLASSTNMFALEPKTGNLRYNMTNVPAGTIYIGPSGEMLKYQLVNYGTADNPNWRLLQWNSSYVVAPNEDWSGYSLGTWSGATIGVSYNATERGYDLNVSISTPLTGSILTVFPMDRIIVGSGTPDAVTLSAISLKSGEEGRLIFQNVVWTAPAAWKTITFNSLQTGWAAFSGEDHIAVFFTKENRVNYGFSLETGKFLWEAKPQIYADAWGGVATNYAPDKIIAYSRLYESTCGGIVYCYDVKTGDLLWAYEATDKYMESYLTENWWLLPSIVSNGKIYLGHNEHSAQEPKPRGAPFLALDAFTGEVVWEIDGAFRQSNWGGRAIIGDSIIVTPDTYDQQIYAIGKGPSAMTLLTPEFTTIVNKPILIKGTVMDISPGTTSKNLQMRFPNGVPAVSDDSMSEWMLYVYKQFERPINAKGVPISVYAVDPNGNDKHLGDTVSDASGTFSLAFTPETEGQYTIYAYFDGSASYYGTSAQNSMIVSATTEQTTDNNLMYGLYAIGIVIIILAVVLVVLGIKKK